MAIESAAADFQSQSTINSSSTTKARKLLPTINMSCSITKLIIALVLTMAVATVYAALPLDTRTLTRADEYFTSDW